MPSIYRSTLSHKAISSILVYFSAKCIQMGSLQGSLVKVNSFLEILQEKVYYRYCHVYSQHLNKVKKMVRVKYFLGFTWYENVGTGILGEGNLFLSLG